jgi:hypothetical protein
VDTESLPELMDLLVVLVPMLAVLAGAGIGINFAMIQEEAYLKDQRAKRVKPDDEDSFQF